MPKVASPVLVIHGTEDEVIDFSHGLAIYDKCPRAVEPLWVEVSCNVIFTHMGVCTLRGYFLKCNLLASAWIAIENGFKGLHTMTCIL